MDITLVLDDHKSSLEVLSEDQILVEVPLAWWHHSSSAA